MFSHEARQRRKEIVGHESGGTVREENRQGIREKEKDGDFEEEGEGKAREETRERKERRSRDSHQRHNQNQEDEEEATQIHPKTMKRRWTGSFDVVNTWMLNESDVFALAHFLSFLH